MHMLEMDMLSGHLIPVKSSTNHYVHKCGAIKTLFDLKNTHNTKINILKCFKLLENMINSLCL